MIKIKVFVYMAILTLALTGCGKEEPDQLTVYSFSGENEQLTVSNGVIALNGTEEIFAGGDLKVTGDLPVQQPDALGYRFTYSYGIKYYANICFLACSHPCAGWLYHGCNWIFQ